MESHTERRNARHTPQAHKRRQCKKTAGIAIQSCRDTSDRTLCHAQVSYLIASYAKDDGALDVGLYYISKVMGRLIGTVLSGWVYQLYGL